MSLQKTMTAFAKTDIPATIDTLEKLTVWCAETLQYLYPNLVTIEALDEDGNPINSRVAESSKFFLTAPTTPEWRHLSRFSIPLSNAHQVSGKIWEHAGNLGTSAIPTGMKS